MNQPANAAVPPALYALTIEQVEFIQQMLAAVPLQGNRQQLAVTLAMMAGIEEALGRPVEKEKT